VGEHGGQREARSGQGGSGAWHRLLVFVLELAWASVRRMSLDAWPPTFAFEQAAEGRE
jgi:hypothetical protein